MEVLAAQCHVLVSLEKLAADNEDAAEFLQDIIFLRWPIVQLILYCAARDEKRGEFAATASLARRVTRQLPYEQIPAKMPSSCARPSANPTP